MPDPLMDKLPTRLEKDIKALWGTEECDRYLDDLMLVGGDRIHRQGFPPETMHQIMVISEAHQILYRFQEFKNWQREL